MELHFVSPIHVYGVHKDNLTFTHFRKEDFRKETDENILRGNPQRPFDNVVCLRAL